MNLSEVLMLIQTIVLGLALGAIGWQICKLRAAVLASNCQDIIENFYRIVEKPEFSRLFSFGPDGASASEEHREKAVLCSMVFAFLEQLYVQASAGELAERLSGPWVDFAKTWVNQEEMKQYWQSSSMICPKSGFDVGFQKFVDATYGV